MRSISTWKNLAIRAAAGILIVSLLIGLFPLQAWAVNYTCELEEHTHSESCYETVETVSFSCSDDLYIHSHDELCYDPSGNLACLLPEATEHTHSDSCYTTLPDSYELTCGLEETGGHTHTQACYVPDGVYGIYCIANHEHTDACYSYAPRDFSYEPQYLLDESGDPVPLSALVPDGWFSGQKFYCWVNVEDGSFFSEALAFQLRILDHEDPSVIYYDSCDVEAPLVLSQPGAYDYILTFHYSDAEGQRRSARLEDTFSIVEPDLVLGCGLSEDTGHVHTEDCYTLPGQYALACWTQHEHTDACYAYVPDSFTGNSAPFLSETGETLPVSLSLPDGWYAGQNFFQWLNIQDPSYFQSLASEISFTISDADTIYLDGPFPEFGFALQDPGQYQLSASFDYYDASGALGHASLSASFSLIEAEPVLACGFSESSGHVHTEDCYELIPGETVLSCALPERHVHDITCYDADGSLTCSLPEASEHTHSEACRTVSTELALTCEIPEHTHSDSCMEGTITIDGISYPISAFHPMDDFLTSAILTSNNTSYDLFTDSIPDGAVNIYQDFDLQLDFEFLSSATGFQQTYSFQFPDVNLPDPVLGQIISDDGVDFGTYYINTDGTIYVALSEEGMRQSILLWGVHYSASWDANTDGLISVDLGEGKTFEFTLDFSKAKAVKNADDSHWIPGQFSYTVNLEALTDLCVTSIDDTITMLSGDAILARWTVLTGIPMEEAIWPVNAAITLPDGSKVPIPESNIMAEYLGISDGFYGGHPMLRFHYDLPEGFDLAEGETAQLTYQLQFDPSFTAYLDFADASFYRLDNEAVFYLDDGSTADAAAGAQKRQRDMIEKELLSSDGDTASWGIYIVPPYTYSLDGLMIQDTLVSDLSYLMTEPFPWTYGDQSGSASICQCSSQAEFDGLTAENSGGMAHIYGSSFKFFIPAVGEAGPDGLFHDGFELFYDTTYSVDVEQLFGSSARINQARVYYEDVWDSSHDYIKSESILKTNDGIHVDADGRLYTNWSVHVEVPAGMGFDRFSFEDYVPVNYDYDEEHASLIWDTPRLNVELEEDREYLFYDFQDLLDTGIGLSIITQSGVDITQDMIHFVYYVDKSGSDSHSLSFSMGDRNHPNYYSGGFDPVDEAYTITLTIPMYLNGDALSFREHSNQIVWYYTEDWKNMSGASEIEVPYVDNDNYLSKDVIRVEESEDGSKTILTYRTRFNMMDKSPWTNYRSGSGYTFSDVLADTNYARYIPDSLKIYWTESIYDDARWTYENEESAYYGESDLLKIQEDVLYKVIEDGDNDVYELMRMATVTEESDAGFIVHIPYCLPTNHFRYYDPEIDDFRYYSPLMEYQVEVDTKALTDNGIYRYSVDNSMTAYLNDGTVEAVANESYVLDQSVLEKAVVQMPDASNDNTIRYQLLVDASSDQLRSMSRIDVVDTIEADRVQLLVDQMAVEYSEDQASWIPMPSDRYRFIYDSSLNRITCLLDNETASPYYRITYSLRLNGLAGDSVFIQNSASIIGFSNQEAVTGDVFAITSTEGYAEGQVARIQIYKYNLDDVEMGLPGATFQLYALSDAVDHAALDGLGSQYEVIQTVGDYSNWTFIAQAETDSDGLITWEHGSNVVLAMNTLYLLVETQAPSGYIGSSDPIFFYLSASNEEPDGFLRFFDREPVQTVCYIANRRSSFVLEKRAGDTGEVLPGASFSLYSDPSCSGEPVAESIDYGDGTYYFGDLPFSSTYYLKETRAPEFYDPLETVYTVSVSSNGVVTISPSLPFENGRYIITNNLKQGASLPSTGGSGTWPIYMAGLILLLFSLGALIQKKEATDES